MADIIFFSASFFTWNIELCAVKPVKLLVKAPGGLNIDQVDHGDGCWGRQTDGRSMEMEATCC